MPMQPVITTLSSPAVRGDTVVITGHGFGRVSSVALVDTTTLVQVECAFQVDTGFSIHFTIPINALDGNYFVLIGTLDNVTGSSDPVFITLPDDSPVVPLPGDYTSQNPIPSYTSPAMAAVRARMRLELGDYAENFSSSVVGDGKAVRFDLPQEVISVTGLIVVTIDVNNGVVPLVAGTDYTLDAAQGIVTLNTPLSTDVTLQVVGTNYQFFLDDELDQFIYSAALKHTHNTVDEVAYRDAAGYKWYNVTQQTVDTLPPVEYHPVALLAAIEALWVMATDASFDINVSTAEGTSLPREERFSNIVELINLKQSQYDKLCEQLGVGLGRIEVFTLRRVSRTTGRLVPIYREKEYDDYSLPERIYVPIDSGKSGPATEAPDPFFGGGGIYP
jgi:hypothetical protein